MTNILGGSQTILRIQRLQKKKGRWRSINEWGKQSKEPNNQITKKWYYDKTKAVLKVKNEEAPQGTCTNYNFAFEYNVHKMES